MSSSVRSSLLWLIFLLILGKEFRLPGGDPFPVQLGESGLPFSTSFKACRLRRSARASIRSACSLCRVWESEIEAVGMGVCSFLHSANQHIALSG